MTEIEQKIKTIVEAKAGMPVADMGQSLRDELGLDSLDIIEITFDVDREFSTFVPDAVWEAATITTVQDMANVVTEYLGIMDNPS